MILNTTTWILIITIATSFFAWNRPDVYQKWILNPYQIKLKGEYWRFITSGFVHLNYMHLFFNMLMTWFFGSTLEQVWGGQRFLKYYLACGLGGAIFFVIFNYNSAVVGASGAVFGLYLAYGMLFPNNYVMVYFLFPVKAKYFVAFISLFQLAYGISGPSGVAYFAHLGGLAAGLLFFRHEIANSRVFRRTAGWWGTVQRTRREEVDDQQSDKIDSILDKIASKGYENLSSTEKRILENYSRKRRDDSE